MVVTRSHWTPRRTASALQRKDGARVAAVVGDITDDDHRHELTEAASELGGLDLVINNAGTLGTSPLPSLADYPLDDLRIAFEVNVVAPLGLLQDALPLLLDAPRPRVINVTSDAAVEAYEGWGGYGAGKAALEHLGAVLAAEFPGVTVWSVDPGDLRTAMHQAAFPGEDISDRPEPSTVVPAFLSSSTTIARAAAGAPRSSSRREQWRERADGAEPGARAPARLPELHPLSFSLPAELEAPAPPEYRGMTRDAVRMLVATKSDGALVHSTFSELPRFLDEGDLVVINTSGTLAAEVDGTTPDGAALQVHLSTRLPAGLWTVEVRRDGEAYLGAAPGDSIELPDGGRVALLAPYSPGPGGLGVRLWVSSVETPERLHSYLARHGRPIRYGYVRGSYPIGAYQNVYATEPGSAEMPSAGRPFTPEVLTRLVAKGIGVAPLFLHTGVASLEANEPPYAEYFRVSLPTAHRINDTRRSGGRVIAIGTTVVRALESVVDDHGHVHPSEGWTETVISPERPVRSIDGFLTGWHEPEASHLAMLEAIAGRPLLESSYAAALEQGYLWHEFGDVHLILP